MDALTIQVNAGQEVAEIARDFERPEEVLREAIHNSYDAGARQTRIKARPGALASGNKVLELEIVDDGVGMNREGLQAFFGLGYSKKPNVTDREKIGFKGHGTKIYYQAFEFWVATIQNDGELLVAGVPDARTAIFNHRLPILHIYDGDQARQLAEEHQLEVPVAHGTSIRLIDFTSNSDRLIDRFRWGPIENYLRWFTVFGSFRHVVQGQQTPTAPMRLLFQGTDLDSLQEVPFGHPWPIKDLVTLKVLKSKDDRRPFNFFTKTVRKPQLAVSGGSRLDIALLFEGSRARKERDSAIRRQGKGGELRLYHEEERYGLWLCKDFIPVEPRFDWLNDEDLTQEGEEHELLRGARPLIFVNCQEFSLTANRGSVGNSPEGLLKVIKEGVFQVIRDALSDKDVIKFLDESREDMFERLREKDKKALLRRIDRYNKKKRYSIRLPNGKEHTFHEPGREITLFGLICELNLLDPTLLELDILDYDDHVGLDLLVRRNGNRADPLDRTKVAYTELKSRLEARINHPFDNMHSIICWDCFLDDADLVIDPTGTQFTYRIEQDGATQRTNFRLIPSAESKLNHNVKVINLRKLLEERCAMKEVPHEQTISTTSSEARGSRKSPGTRRKK